MKIFILLFVVFNFITFGIFAFDKFLARTHRNRISEKTLITLAMIGGSVGAIFAQKFFRHKTRKFRYILWIIFIIQFIAFESIWLYSSNALQTIQNTFGI